MLLTRRDSTVRACRLLTATMVTYALVATSTRAAENYAVWGIGQASCNQFKHAFDDARAQDYSHFLAGYLTAFSTFSTAARPSPEQPLKTRLQQIADYCTDHRMDSFERAIQATMPPPEPQKASATWGRPAPSKDTPR